MNFTIITPCFNQLDYLKRCMASVADQVTAGTGHLASGIGKQGAIDRSAPLASSPQPKANSSLSVHHHVPDGGSRDGTREFLGA